MGRGKGVLSRGAGAAESPVLTAFLEPFASGLDLGLRFLASHTPESSLIGRSLTKQYQNSPPFGRHLLG